MRSTCLPLGSVMLLMALSCVIGCAQGTPDQQPAAEAATSDTAAAETHADHDHGGWWCAPHGVPEEECGICNAKLAADFQRKGDWCTDHDRPDSQCFVCHPELAAAFAARYEAKYGEPPPKPEG